MAKMPGDMPTADEVPEAEELRDRVDKLQREHERGTAQGKPDPATAENTPDEDEDEDESSG